MAFVEPSATQVAFEVVGGVVQIGGSVGRGGKNLPDDVKVVQALLNRNLSIPLARLDVNGICSSQTIFAIETYQRLKLGMSQPDGRADPGGATIRSLSGLPAHGGSPSQPAGGKKYTDNPNEVVTKTTVPPLRELISALLLNWPEELKENGARTLAAQVMHETGWGKYCFNWNIGNVKSGANDLHMYLHNVWECESKAAAQNSVSHGNGLVRVATDEEIKKHGWVCAGKETVVFSPPHPACRFRAYLSLADSVKSWILRHKGYAQRNAGYLDALNTGDTTTVAHVLKKAGYYSGPETIYARNMADTKKEIDKKLGPLP